MRRAAVCWLWVQGAGGTLWWILVLASPGFRAWFVPPGAPLFTLHAFALPDLVFVIAGSLAAARGLARARAWAWPVLCATAGAVGYATLYAAMLAALAGGAWASALLMAPPLALTAYFAYGLRP
jgi:hypothetical protein